MKQTTPSRLVFIDLAKGLTMLTILWGHVMLTGYSNAIVYAFHIPTYFFLAGMVYRGEKYPSAMDLAKRRVVTLLLPYCFYSLVTWGFWLLDCLSKGISLDGCFRPLLQTILAQGSGGYLVHNPALWFVPCLFLVELMYFYISRLTTWKNLMVCVILAALGWGMMQFGLLKKLPWSLETACAAVIFYACGNLFARKYALRELPGRAARRPVTAAALILICGILLSVGGIANGTVSMAQGNLGNVLIFYPTAMCGIFFMLILCIALEGAMGRNALLDRILGWFCWLGRSSFYMMVLHIPVMLVCVRTVSVFSGRSLTDVRYDWRYTLPAWLGMVVISALLTFGIQKCKAAYGKTVDK